MEARPFGHEDSSVEVIRRLLLQVEETIECRRLGDTQVVADENANPTFSVEEVAHVFLDQGHSAFQSKGGEKIRARGLVKVSSEVR
jgi:hypothetical protein